MDKNIQTFFALLQAGLWEKEVRLLPHGEVDLKAVYDLAEEQSVVGLIAAGIEHVSVKPQKKDVIQLIGRVTQLEQRNKAMNRFIGMTVEKMREAGGETLLVKGQGVAQCYERPLWRTCGDVDFFLDNENYERAKVFLTPLASEVETEYKGSKHLGMTIGSWVVELHGTLRGGLSERINRVMDEIQRDTFNGRNVRSWDNGGVPVMMLSVENDIVYVFSHFINHFFKEGLGLRQICDWCRLIWTFRESMDVKKVKSLIQRLGLMTEWMAFGTFAVEYLGLPLSVYGSLFGNEKDLEKYRKKAERINSFILEVGNMGHNRDSSYFSKYPYLIRKWFSMKRRIGDLWNHARIFPLDSLKFFFRIMYYGVRSAMRGE